MVDTVTIIIIAHNPCRHALVPSLVRRLFEYLPRKWNCSLGERGCIYQAGLEGKERLCRLASPHCWASSSTWDRAQGHLLTAPSPPSLSAGCSEAASEGASRICYKQPRSVQDRFSHVSKPSPTHAHPLHLFSNCQCHQSSARFSLNICNM